MWYLKEPKRLADGKVDREWWNAMSSDERMEYEVWQNEVEDVDDKKNPMEVVIKPEALDTSNLEADSKAQTLWRPSEFSEYIGQENLKKILKGYIKGTKELNRQFPHMLIDGQAGTGKTTIAYLLAKKLNIPFVETVATTLQSQQQLVDKIVECKGGILFLDEVHMLNAKLSNFILPILEDFQINGQKIKPFTLFTCTTEKGMLIKKFKPLVDRMKIQFTLEDYTVNELKTLIMQYQEKSFKEVTIEESVFNKIASNCRFTPRIAIRFLESFIFMQCSINEVFQSYGIVKDGINKSDIKVLKLLNEYEKGIGLQAISSHLGTSEENYLYSVESYLLQKGFMTRLARGRAITEKGKAFLQGIKS